MAKTKPLHASLKWPDVKDDYVVRYDGHLVGRIRLGGRALLAAWDHVGVEYKRPDGDAGLGEWER